MHSNVKVTDNFTSGGILINGLSSSSSQVFLEWLKQQRHHEDHYSRSKYEQYQRVL